MAERKASDVFVECLEAEGVRYVFGIPGEETLDLSESLADSSIEFVPVRHEQGGAYMADAIGRLTGRAGVCLGTLGPGATNLVTAVADAFLDRAPLVALTGQSDLERMHKESHQYIDLIGILRPVVKWNARVSSPEIVPEVVRKAFKVAESEKPGATHLELPEDVMARPLDATPLPSPRPGPARAGGRELQRAAEIIAQAENPVALVGNGAIRARAGRALRYFARPRGSRPRRRSWPRACSTTRIRTRSAPSGSSRATTRWPGSRTPTWCIAIGYDLVEHAPEHWNPRRDKRIIVIDSVAAEIDEFFIPEVELIGDIAHVMARLAAGCQRTDARSGSSRLRDLVLGALRDARDDSALPDAPTPGAVGHPRGARPRGHAGLGRWTAQAVDRADVPRARAQHGADRQRPRRHGVRAADGDRCQARPPRPPRGGGVRRRRLSHELPGARDRGAAAHAVVNVIWENGQFGSIVWKQDKKFGRHFGVDFGNPDFVKLAESFGMPAWRCATADEFSQRLATRWPSTCPR